jgi:O-antigen ligase
MTALDERTGEVAAPHAAVDVMPAHRRRDHGGSTVTLLTTFIVLQYFMPSNLVVAGPLGAAGAPAALYAMALLLWRLGVWVRWRQRIPSPARTAMVVYFMCVLASYIALATRQAIGDEQRAGDRAVLATLGWLGIVSVTADLLHSRRELEIVLRRFVLAVEILAAIGIVEFFSGFDLVGRIHIPGLRSNVGYTNLLLSRDGLNRPSVTATHPIEFGMVLALALPLAVHFALFAADRSRRRWIGIAAITVCLPMTLSKSAIVATVVLGLFIVPTWPGRFRRRTLAALPFVIAAMRFAVPGLVGTVVGLFTSAGSDTSTTSRTGDYGPAWKVISARPLFGRGDGTYLAEYYRTLDNQYLHSLIEVGFVGLVVTVGFFATSVTLARSARRRFTSEEDRNLAQTLAASLLASMISIETFDAFSFPQATGTLMLLLGVAGTLWRFAGGYERRGAVRRAGHEGVATREGGGAGGTGERGPSRPPRARGAVSLR